MLWRPSLLAATCFAMIAAGCGGKGGGADARPDDNFDRRALLRNVGENIIVPTLTALDTAASAQVTAINAYCAAIDGADEATALAAAQVAWRTAMESVQRAEVMQLGPSADNDGALRDELYSWPLTSTCAVDQDVKTRFDDPGSFDVGSQLTNRRGMDALEYVLFSTSLEHTCAGPVAPPGWDALPESDRKNARCGFAADAAADVAVTTGVLLDAWTGGFLEDFATAGQGGSSFASAQAALNLLSDAMFYVEFEVKDIKLGESSGITENSCGFVGEACIEELESQFATHSKENVVASLIAFRELFVGGDGVGFDDMLTELGAGELSVTMVTDIDAMVAAGEAIPGTMRDALIADYADVVATHVAIKAVTDNFKSQFLTVLGLDIPENSAGDND